MTPRVHAYTSAGPRCAHNEDDALAHVGDAVVLGVWDGVGGRPCGEVAARLARETFAELGVNPDPAELRAMAEGLHRRLLDESAARGLLEPMACVGTVLWLRPDPTGAAGWMAHIGDTRAFCFDHAGGGAQLTRDHSAVYQEGTPESASLAAPRRNEISACFGLDDAPLGDRLDIEAVLLRPGQTVVLCTDGVSDFVDRPALARLAAAASSPSSLAAAIVEAAEAGQQHAPKGDNIGIVVASLPREVPPPTGDPWRVARALAPLALGVLLGFGFGSPHGQESTQPPDLPAAARAACDATQPPCRLEHGDLSMSAPWELAGDWPSVAVDGGGAALVAASGGRLVVPGGGEVELSDLTLHGGAPQQIAIGPEAVLRLLGVVWRADDADVEVTLAPGARLDLVGCDLTFGSLEVHFEGEDGAGARVDLAATRLVVAGSTPLFPRPPGGASVRIDPASTVHLGDAPLFDPATGCARASEVLAESSGGTIVSLPADAPWRTPRAPRCPVRPGGLVWHSEDPG